MQARGPSRASGKKRGGGGLQLEKSWVLCFDQDIRCRKPDGGGWLTAAAGEQVGALFLGAWTGKGRGGEGIN